ncbi:carbohydrate-binding protein [Polaribacter sp. 20A6]|uniref:carbohydrate-binding protein n=1 Tax=Polaribacter sp. 20A6 TaxID=2687289 RepID=UPI0013FE1E1B|nr:carbohydrate-binding protein [Polaribacter sp. 20A6]
MIKKLFIALLFVIPIIVNSQTQVTVNSLLELRNYLDVDNYEVTLSPGTYTIDASIITSENYANSRLYELTGGTNVLLAFEGNNNIYNFTGVTINFDTDIHTKAFSGEVFQIQTYGNNNILNDLTMVDDGSKFDMPNHGGVNLVLDGEDNTINNFNMLVKASYPYGFGDTFGKGSGALIKHNKHSGVLIRGTRNTVKNSKIVSRAYGHIMFFQGAIDGLIENCIIEGEMRSTDNMFTGDDLTDEEFNSVGYKRAHKVATELDFLSVWGYQLPKGYYKSLNEAGIRAYGSGVTIINGEVIDRNTVTPVVKGCTISGSRAAVTLSQASGKESIIDCIALSNERGFALADGELTNCSADAKYGAALSCDSNNGITGDLTILPYEGEEMNGSKTLVFLSGKDHNLTIRNAASNTNPDQDLKIKLSGDFTDIGNLDVVDVFEASDITLNNYTNYPLILSSKAANNNGVSGGVVTDYGTNNIFNHSAVSILRIEAEEFITPNTTITTEKTSDMEGGNNVTDIDTGDVLEYEIDVPLAGTYTMGYRVASASTNGDFTVSLNGSSQLEQVSFNTGGTQTWTTVVSTTPFTLEKGVQTITLISNASDWNINYMDLLLECAVVPIIPYIEEFNNLSESLGKKETTDLTLFLGNTVVLDPEPSIGGTWSWIGPNGYISGTRKVTLSDFKEHQAGIYQVTHTNDCGQLSTEDFNISVQTELLIEAEDYTAMTGVTVETTSDTIGRNNITSIDRGDILEYEIDVPFTGNYTIDYRVASTTAGSFTININSKELEQISFDATGGSQTWTTTSSSSQVYLKEGAQTLQIVANSAGWNINWLKLNVNELVRPCDLPLNSAGFNIQNTTVNWSSIVDISCESDLSIFFTVEGMGDLKATDYLNIYYKLDGGEKVYILEQTGALDAVVAKVEGGITGDFLELIIESNSENEQNYYKISNISILNIIDPFARLEIEDADDAGFLRTEETSDVGGGLNAGWTSSGDWYKFSNLDLTEVKSVNARIASVESYSLQVRIDAVDGPLIAELNVPVTGGYQVWETINANIDAQVGIHDVYFVITGSYNLNWFELSKDVLESPFEDGRLEVEDYDAAYAKNDSGDDKPRTESTSDENGGLNVGWITSGDWYMFKNQDLTGIKSIDARLSGNNNDASIEIRLDAVDGTLIGTINVPNTNGDQNWETVTTGIDEVIGEYDLYFVVVGNGFNTNWFRKNTSLLSTESNLIRGLNIFPNPVSNYLVISGESCFSANTTLEIYDVNGRQILKKTSIENYNEQKIDVSALNKGIYILVIKDSKNSKVVKFIKK